MRMEPKVAILALVALLCAAQARDNAQDNGSQDSAAAAVSAFYSVHLSVRPNGLPSEKDLSRLAPFMSKRLVSLVRAALAYQARFIREHPDKPSPGGGPIIAYKPPFIDGDYLSMGFDERPSSFRVGVVAQRGATYKVDVHFTHQSAPEYGNTRFDWTNVAIVVREGGRFVLDDVESLGNWPFGKHALLSTVRRAR